MRDPSELEACAVGESAGVFPMVNWNNANGGGAGGPGSGPITGTQVLQFENPTGSGQFNTGIQSPVANTVADNLGVPDCRDDFLSHACERLVDHAEPRVESTAIRP